MFDNINSSFLNGLMSQTVYPVIQRITYALNTKHTTAEGLVSAVVKSVWKELTSDKGALLTSENVQSIVRGIVDIRVREIAMLGIKTPRNGDLVVIYTPDDSGLVGGQAVADSISGMYKELGLASRIVVTCDKDIAITVPTIKDGVVSVAYVTEGENTDAIAAGQLAALNSQLSEKTDYERALSVLNELPDNDSIRYAKSLIEREIANSSTAKGSDNV